MPSPLSRTTRRVRTLALAGALAAGGLLVAPAPSEAGAILGITQTGAEIDFDSSPTGTTCTETGPGDDASIGTFAANGVPVTHTVSSSATVTDDGNPSDVTNLSSTVSHTVTATSVGGQMSKVHIVTAGSGSATTAIAATKCGAEVGYGGSTLFQFDLPVDTVVTVTGVAHRMGGVVQAGNILGPTPDDIQAVIAYAFGSASSSSALIKAGTGFIAINESFDGVTAPDTASTVTRSGDVTFDITFDTPGVAEGSQFGSGGKYVKLSAGRGCPAGTVDLTWTKKAGKGDHRTVKKATVLVDGDKVKTVKKPKKKQVTHLTGLAPDQDARVQVVLKVKDKGELYTERSYLQCT